LIERATAPQAQDAHPEAGLGGEPAKEREAKMSAHVARVLVKCERYGRRARCVEERHTEAAERATE
jgi:hypothetical protein